MIALLEAQKKYGIGLTGGIACGKSTVANIIRAQGYPVVDADELARLAVRPGSPTIAKIVDAFGGRVLSEDGSLNRKLMASIIFQDQQQKQTLENIVHPALHKELDVRLRDLKILEQPQTWFYEATLLYETGSYQLYREIWAVHCSEETQIERIRRRQPELAISAEKIIANQMPAADKAKRAQVVINTDCTMEELERRVKSALQKLRAQQSVGI